MNVAEAWFLHALSEHTKNVSRDKLTEASKGLAATSIDVQFYTDKTLKLGFIQITSQARRLREDLEDGLDAGLVDLPAFIKTTWGEESYVAGDIPERQEALAKIRGNIGL